MTCGAGAIVRGFEPALDDTRFDAVGAFSQSSWIIGTMSDLPFTKHNWFGAATLFTPNMVILARHLLGTGYASPASPPPAGHFAVRFRRRPDGGIGSTTTGWWSYHNVKIQSYVYPDDPSIDMVIGILEQPVMHIEPIAVRPGTRPNSGDPLFIAGWGYDQFGSCSNPQGVRDRLRVAQTQAKDGFMWCFLVEYPSASNAGVAGPTCHDSGGAIISVDPDGALTLVGVVRNTSGGYFVDTFNVLNPDYQKVCCYDPQGRCADATGDSFVDNDDLTFVRANSGPCPVGVPCPADLNGDGTVNVLDEVMIFGQINTRCGVSQACPGDLNYDGVVDGGDLGILTFGWGLNPCIDTADIDKDGLVNGRDMGILLSTWGTCP
jgi:hypothetical protein